jgi:hypothetical protein
VTAPNETALVLSVLPSGRPRVEAGASAAADALTGERAASVLMRSRGAGPAGPRDDAGRIANADLSDVFGIEIDMGPKRRSTARRPQK